MKRIMFCGVCVLMNTAAHADWFRDFNDGTLQDLAVMDLSGAAFTLSGVGGSLRFQSNADGDNNDSVLALDPAQFTDTSATLSIRFSTNPNFPPFSFDARMNGGLFIRADAATLNGYLLLLDDAGNLQLYKVLYGEVHEICPGTSSVPVTGFTPTYDWRMRFEAITEGSGVRLRGRTWREREPEHCIWQIDCVDSVEPYASGIVSLLVNEDENGYFLDLDNAGASSTISCAEVCDNNVDDNEDGLADCHDPQCANVAVCACRTPFADADGDGDVDIDDFGFFQRCYSGSGIALNAQCGCFDRDDMNNDGHFQRAIDGNGYIDAADLAAFTACYTGPSVPADPHCGE